MGIFSFFCGWGGVSGVWLLRLAAWIMVGVLYLGSAIMGMFEASLGLICPSLVACGKYSSLIIRKPYRGKCGACPLVVGVDRDGIAQPSWACALSGSGC